MHHAERLGRLLHRLDEYLAHQRNQDRDDDQGRHGDSDRQGNPARFAMTGAGEQVLVGLQRKQQAEAVCGDQQDGEAHADFLRHRIGSRQIQVGDRRRRDQGDGCHQQQRRIQPRPQPVEFLDMVPEPAEQKRRPKHEQGIGDDRAGDRCLDEHVLSGVKRGHGDDQFGEIAKRGIEEPADGVAGSFGHRFGGMAEQRGKRHDGHDRHCKQQRVCIGGDPLDRDHRRHENQQPEQGVLPDFLQQKVHGRRLG